MSGRATKANVLLPVEGYPVSAEAVRAWFRHAYGREASEIELGELLEAMARRESDRIEAGEGRSRE